METSVDQTGNQDSYAQSNPLTDMSLGRSDVDSFQPDGEYYSRIFLFRLVRENIITNFTKL